MKLYSQRSKKLQEERKFNIKKPGREANMLGCVNIKSTLLELLTGIS
jgi:hypothetical protein